METVIDFQSIKKVYFIGIKGSGMIALVEILHAMGKEVVGSDTTDVYYTDSILKDLSLHYYEGFSRENLQKESPVDLVIYSLAYSEDNNDEMRYVKENDLPHLSLAEATGQLMKNRYSIAVCGTHGKTTSTAMLALAMKNAGADPTAMIGSKIKSIGRSTLIGQGDFFVIEADEYKGKFLHYNPMAVILTSIDYDHPDYFSSLESCIRVFEKFVQKVPAHGFLVAWAGSLNTLAVAKSARCKIVLYGYFENNVEKEKLAQELLAAGKNNFEIVEVPENLDLKIPGRHNRLNATAVLATCRQLKLDEEKVIEALNNYEGTARRFEKLGQYQGADVIDDYGHHPEEIRATLAATKERYPDKNIICVFHPHTFTRTAALLDEFARSFSDCHEVIVLDIYGSAREKHGGVHSQDLVEKIRQSKYNVEYIPTIDQAFDYLKDKLSAKDVLITMGAGNGNELGERLVKREERTVNGK